MDVVWQGREVVTHQHRAAVNVVEALPGDGLVPEALVRQQLVDGALVLEDGAEVVVAVEDCHLLVRQRGGDLAQALARALGGVALEKGPD